MNQRKKIAGITVVIILLSVAAWLLVERATPTESDRTNTNTTAEEKQPTEPDNSLRLIATGDMLPHDTVNLRAETSSGYDYKQFFINVQELFDSADIAICNQEAPSGGDTFGVSGYPSFNAPVEFAEDLSAVGCNVIGLANNHLGDKGNGALEATIKTWQGLEPLAQSGVGEPKVSYFDQAGFRFAFLAFTDHQNRFNSLVYPMTETFVEPLLQEAQSNADYVIVNAHWGSEVDTNVLDSQREWANRLAELGADVVFGSGPHVLQPVEKIGDTTVWYSLGNMLSTQLELEQLIGGFAVMDFDTADGELKLKHTSFFPTYMHYEWTANEEAAQDLLARRNLLIYPIESAAEPLRRTRFNSTTDGLLEMVRNKLGMNTELLSIEDI